MRKNGARALGLDYGGGGGHGEVERVCSTFYFCICADC